jgi:hypothetical protein
MSIHSQRLSLHEGLDESDDHLEHEENLAVPHCKSAGEELKGVIRERVRECAFCSSKRGDIAEKADNK